MEINTKSIAVTDRTLADVLEENDKGTYQAVDLNRLVVLTNYMYNQLTRFGISLKNNRSEKDIKWNILPCSVGVSLNTVGNYVLPNSPYNDKDLSDADRMNIIATNIQSIRRSIKLAEDSPDAPDSLRFMSYISANNLEQIIVLVEQTLYSLSKVFPRAGTAWNFSGNSTFAFKN